MSGKYLCFNDLQFTQFRSCSQVTTCPPGGCRCYPIGRCPLQQYTFGTCYSPINQCTGSYILTNSLDTFAVRAQASEGRDVSTLAIYTDLRFSSPTRRPTFVNATTDGGEGGGGGGGGLPIATSYIIFGVIGIVALIVLVLVTWCCCARKASKTVEAKAERAAFELVNVNEEVNI